MRASLHGLPHFCLHTHTLLALSAKVVSKGISTDSVYVLGLADGNAPFCKAKDPLSSLCDGVHAVNAFPKSCVLLTIPDHNV